MSKRFSIEKSTGFIIYRTALAMRASLQRVLKEQEFDITPEQYGILMLLREEEGLSQKEIGDVLFKDKPNISRMLDALERKRLILRQSSDRRSFAIFLRGQKPGRKDPPHQKEIGRKSVRRLIS